jgi:hypothetical protein
VRTRRSAGDCWVIAPRPAMPAPGIPVVWTCAGQYGIVAGKDMCPTIGGDHVCSYDELVVADQNGELVNLPRWSTR